MLKRLTVILGGDLSTMWSNGEVIPPDGVALTRCCGAPGDILAHSQRLAPCVLVVDGAFAEKVNFEDFYNIVDFGLSVRVLVELDRQYLGLAEHLIRIGCAGYIPKGAKPAEAWNAVQAVAAGQLWAPRSVVSKVLLNVLREARHRLTFRESEILGLLSNGLTNLDIGKRLFISPQTVRWHLRNLYSKLGTHDRAGAVTQASDTPPRIPKRRPAREMTAPVSYGEAGPLQMVLKNRA